MEHAAGHGVDRRSPTPFDVLIAVGALAVDLGGALITAHRHGEARLSALGVCYLVAAAVPLVWRRRWPIAIAALVGVASAAYGIAELPDPPVQVAMLIALFTVAYYEPRRTTFLLAAVATAGAVVGIILAGDSGPDDYYAFFLPGALALVLGDRQRTQAAYLAGAKERADALELDQLAASERAVEAERARIARELHDVVAHHVSMIVVQAEAGAASAPPVGAERFDAIATTGRAAMTELRRLLGVLRESGQGPSTAPQPGLDQVAALVAQVRDAGVPVTLRIEGEPRALSDGVDVSAYRIVQEALTNVVRHAGGASARVSLRYTADAIHVCVENNGTQQPAAATSAPGHGLVGIRERIALLHGDLRAGPRPDGGFEIAARLPLDGVGIGR